MYALFYDAEKKLGYHGIAAKATANEVSLSSIPKDQQALVYLFWNMEAYSLYCKEYKEYWDWVEKRNDSRYQTNLNHGKNYDSKNMMHTIRLLQVAEEILRDGTLNVKRSNRKQLLDIKSGNMNYDDLLMMADKLMESIESYCLTSPLPNVHDKNSAEKVLVEIREKLYR